jgi:hypothetical protein
MCMLVMCFSGECTVSIIFGVTEHEMWHVGRCRQLRPGIKTAARSCLVPSERKYSQENKDLIAQSHDFAKT